MVRFNAHQWQGALVVGLICVAVVVATSDITHMYLRQDPSTSTWLLAGSALLITATLGKLRVRPGLLVIGLLLWVLTTLFWSIAPASTARATMWTFLGLSAVFVGMSWPRATIIGVLVTNLLVVANGLDILLVTGTSHFQGVWFNKNVQASQMLIIVPFLAYWACQSKRYAPYFSFLLGPAIVLTFLTRSLAAQILVLLCLFAAILYFSLRVPRPDLRTAAFTIALLLSGSILAVNMIQPTGVQILGLGLGVGDVGQSMSKSNTAFSLSHRLEMLTYGLKAAKGSSFLGQGGGTMRDIYPSLKEMAGLNVPDIHNVYVQSLATLGVPGLVLLCAVLLSAIRVAVRARRWPLAASVFLFAGYLAWDVSAYFPPLMILFFALTGAALGSGSSARDSGTITSSTATRAAVVGTVATVLLVGLWWLQPCTDSECALNRKLAAEDVVTDVYQASSPTERLSLGLVATARNPISVWPRLITAEAHIDNGNLEAGLEVYREAAIQMPFATDDLYIGWYRTSIELGNIDEAAQARRAALETYGFDPADVQ